jgi:hypothetical protein
VSPEDMQRFEHQMRGVGAWMNLTTRQYEAKCTCGEVFADADHDAAIALLRGHLSDPRAELVQRAGEHTEVCP